MLTLSVEVACTRRKGTVPVLGVLMELHYPTAKYPTLQRCCGTHSWASQLTGMGGEGRVGLVVADVVQ